MGLHNLALGIVLQSRCYGIPSDDLQLKIVSVSAEALANMNMHSKLDCLVRIIQERENGGGV